MSDEKKIIIIDDDCDMVEAMKIMLNNKNYQVFTAYSTEEGFQKVKEDKPDLIVLDVMFGSKGISKGFDCTLNIRKDKNISSIPILMITAVNKKYNQLGDFLEDDGTYLPVDDFINKPVQLEDLLKKVKQLLDIKISRWTNWPIENT